MISRSYTDHVSLELRPDGFNNLQVSAFAPDGRPRKDRSMIATDPFSHLLATKNEPAGRRLRSGRITLKSKDGRYALSVPYSVQVLEG